jgi:hypothetical protein
MVVGFVWEPLCRVSVPFEVLGDWLREMCQLNTIPKITVETNKPLTADSIWSLMANTLD